MRGCSPLFLHESTCTNLNHGHTNLRRTLVLSAQTAMARTNYRSRCPNHSPFTILSKSGDTVEIACPCRAVSAKWDLDNRSVPRLLPMAGYQRIFFPSSFSPSLSPQRQYLTEDCGVSPDLHQRILCESTESFSSGYSMHLGSEAGTVGSERRICLISIPVIDAAQSREIESMQGNIPRFWRRPARMCFKCSAKRSWRTGWSAPMGFSPGTVLFFLPLTRDFKGDHCH